jgi:hypothetical protein
MLTPVLYVQLICECIKHRLIKRNRTRFITVALRVPSILHSTLAALCAQRQTLRIMHYVKQVQYVETQEGHIFSHHYLWSRSTSDIVIFGYVDVISLKDIPPDYGRFLLEHPV